MNKPGVVAGITAILADYNINILEIKQNIIKELFSLIMVVDVDKSEVSFADIKEKLEKKAKDLGIQILIQHENIFRYMHRV
jgi:ACT domain-containing protein